MMILAALLLAAAPPAPTPAWLAGLWVPLSDASRQDADACDGDDTKLWRRDGSFASASGDGAWRLNGSRLTEADDRGTAVSRIVRLGPNLLRVTDAEGEQVDWRRCRAPR